MPRPGSMLCVTLLLGACSSEPGAAGGAGGATLGGAGAGGSASVAGGGATATGGAGTSALGGVSTAGSGGGASGVAGGGAGGVAGGGGTGDAALLAVGTTFDKYRVECACGEHTGNGNCDLPADVDVQRKMVTVAGDPAALYDVQLHVRGVVEPNQYTDGMAAAGAQHFYVGGGKSTTPNYTWYSLVVTDPPQMYFFNFGQVNGHTHILVDDHATIRVRGGTTAFFGVNDQVAFNKDKPSGSGAIPDGHHVSNDPNDVVPGVPPDPEPYDGQFLQLDVESVALVK